MSDLDTRQNLSDLLRDLATELKSTDLEDMRLRLLAFERVDEALTNLREDCDIQVYRGANVVEEYRRSRQLLEESTVRHVLDYIVRKDNVELQVEVRLAQPEGFCLDANDIERYRDLLGSNPKTEEIVLVWATEGLHSVALGMDDVWNGEPKSFGEEQLRPLKDTIVAVLSELRPILRKPTDIQEMRKIEFDLLNAFSKTLDSKLNELVESAERRRSTERVLAIRSISESDKREILALFRECQVQGLDADDLEARLRAICENVNLEQDDP